jgi:hypothetical protein
MCKEKVRIGEKGNLVCETGGNIRHKKGSVPVRSKAKSKQRRKNYRKEERTEHGKNVKQGPGAKLNTDISSAEVNAWAVTEPTLLCTRQLLRNEC